jgi:hypothetical protein
VKLAAQSRELSACHAQFSLKKDTICNELIKFYFRIGYLFTDSGRMCFSRARRLSRALQVPPQINGELLRFYIPCLCLNGLLANFKKFALQRLQPLLRLYNAMC